VLLILFISGWIYYVSGKFPETAWRCLRFYTFWVSFYALASGDELPPGDAGLECGVWSF